MTKGERTRRRIIEEASVVFNRKGYAGASIYDVMDAAEIKKGGLYGHFRGKEEIVLEAFSHAARRQRKHMHDAVNAADTADEKLIALAETFEPLATDDRGGCPLLNAAVEVDDETSHPDLRGQVRSVFSDWRGLIGDIVRGGIRRGEVRPHVDPDVVASVVISTLEGAVMLSRIERDPAHIRRAIDHLAWYARQEIRAAS